MSSNGDLPDQSGMDAIRRKIEARKREGLLKKLSRARRAERKLLRKVAKGKKR